MQQRDGVWKEIGLSTPARRGLVEAMILKVADLTRFTQTQIESLHGLGPSSVPKLPKPQSTGQLLKLS